MGKNNINTIQNINDLKYNITYKDLLKKYISVLNLGQRYAPKGDGVTTISRSILDYFDRPDDITNYDGVKATIVDDTIIKLWLYKYNKTNPNNITEDLQTIINVEQTKIIQQLESNVQLYSIAPNCILKECTKITVEKHLFKCNTLVYTYKDDLSSNVITDEVSYKNIIFNLSTGKIEHLEDNESNIIIGNEINNTEDKYLIAILNYIITCYSEQIVKANIHNKLLYTTIKYCCQLISESTDTVYFNKNFQFNYYCNTNDTTQIYYSGDIIFSNYITNIANPDDTIFTDSEIFALSMQENIESENNTQKSFIFNLILDYYNERVVDILVNDKYTMPYIYNDYWYINDVNTRIIAKGDTLDAINLFVVNNGPGNNVINNGDNLPRFELLSSVSDNSIRDEINNANNWNTHYTTVKYRDKYYNIPEFSIVNNAQNIKQVNKYKNTTIYLSYNINSNEEYNDRTKAEFLTFVEVFKYKNVNDSISYYMGVTPLSENIPEENNDASNYLTLESILSFKDNVSYIIKNYPFSDADDETFNQLIVDASIHINKQNVLLGEQQNENIPAYYILQSENTKDTHRIYPQFADTINYINVDNYAERQVESVETKNPWYDTYFNTDNIITKYNKSTNINDEDKISSKQNTFGSNIPVVDNTQTFEENLHIVNAIEFFRPITNSNKLYYSYIGSSDFNNEKDHFIIGTAKSTYTFGDTLTSHSYVDTYNQTYLDFNFDNVCHNSNTYYHKLYNQELESININYHNDNCFDFTFETQITNIVPTYIDIYNQYDNENHELLLSNNIENTGDVLYTYFNLLGNINHIGYVVDITNLSTNAYINEYLSTIEKLFVNDAYFESNYILLNNIENNLLKLKYSYINGVSYINNILSDPLMYSTLLNINKITYTK